jgi:hypothetical protein
MVARLHDHTGGASKETAMPDTLAPLTIDFLTWLAAGPRDYNEVMEAWRTSCPRLTVWEDAIDAGLITSVHVQGQPLRIALTPAGRRLLREHTNSSGSIPMKISILNGTLEIILHGPRWDGHRASCSRDSRRVRTNPSWSLQLTA